MKNIIINNEDIKIIKQALKEYIEILKIYQIKNTNISDISIHQVYILLGFFEMIDEEINNETRI